ncbi:MAG: hypothetical protein A2X28_01720 [Elusimicrobia bacterium GWA2_56_46]|jgi:thiol-disulfide isomerase/thioredoxin|nr:MAG: hypothetical protein A2X28_01720 [Elusimicrobia bacterium GWA2_56_46]OGR53874.1 MAG: hypothetical protein A2X39_07120 [Elusimicrobia bacterium GWC2_56_31]HBB66000.1 hypothetical protein [Elusimicrobiota bacterium]HBW22728.1 hypothetical protein [Elusimicrobiota bacterium]
MGKTPILALSLGCIIAFTCLGCKKREVPGSAGQAIESRVQAADAAKAPGAAGKEKAYAKKDSYFKLPGYKGGDIDLASYGGKPVMLMFFTEGCPYCRKAAPFIEKMHEKYSSRGLSVIGICLEDELSAAAGFARDFNLTFPIAYKGRETAGQYRTQGVPFIFLLTKEHIVHNVWAGYDPQFDNAIIKGIEEVIK